MTDKKFTELVNLYVDREISVADLERLKLEISACPERKRVFVERCRLHKAMRLALNPQRRRHPRRSSVRSPGRRTAPRGSHRSRPYPVATRISMVDDSLGRSSAGRLPRWVLAGGLLGSLALSLLLLTPVFRDTTAARAQPALVGVNPEDLVASDPLESLGRAELKRYAAAQQRSTAQYEASLIAQMRLMGLRPELTPADKQLLEVDIPAYHQPQRTVNRAALLQRLQAQQSIPAPKLLHIQEWESSDGARWPGGFEFMSARLGEF